MPKTRLADIPISKLPKPKADRKPEPWAGAATLLVILMVGLLAALCDQAGMNATIDLDPRELYYIFFSLGFVGMTVGGLVETNGHVFTYHPLHHTPETVCTITNTLVYAAFILLWVAYHGDDRLKK